MLFGRLFFNQNCGLLAKEASGQYSDPKAPVSRLLLEHLLMLVVLVGICILHVLWRIGAVLSVLAK